ncbi:unnamed protein product [Linum trigynum]|uniref:Uncharacterized protein n=1 Tax=Linum trigynum TaxID=586398 RepID=A0AAV2DS17_9ROSI
MAAKSILHHQAAPPPTNLTAQGLTSGMMEDVVKHLPTPATQPKVRRTSKHQKATNSTGRTKPRRGSKIHLHKKTRKHGSNPSDAQKNVDRSITDLSKAAELQLQR